MNITFLRLSFALTAKCSHIAPYRFLSIRSSSNSLFVLSA